VAAWWVTCVFSVPAADAGGEIGYVFHPDVQPGLTPLRLRACWTLPLTTPTAWDASCSRRSWTPAISLARLASPAGMRREAHFSAAARCSKAPGPTWSYTHCWTTSGTIVATTGALARRLRRALRMRVAPATLQSRRASFATFAGEVGRQPRAASTIPSSWNRRTFVGAPRRADRPASSSGSSPAKTSASSRPAGAADPQLSCRVTDKSVNELGKTITEAASRYSRRPCSTSTRTWRGSG